MHIVSPRCVGTGLALLCLCGKALLAQPGAILVGKTIPISSDASDRPHAESFIAASKTHVGRLLATSYDFRTDGISTVLYESRDGGRAWRRVSFQGAINVYRNAGDPITYFDANGSGFYAAMTRDGLWLARTTKARYGWSHPARIPLAGLVDRPFLAFDRNAGSHGRMYVVGHVFLARSDGAPRWAPAVARSDDSGRTFSPPRIITLKDESSFRPIDPLVTPHGTLVVPVLTVHLEGGRQSTGGYRLFHLRILTSRDGGNTLSISDHVIDLPRPDHSTADGFSRDQRTAGGISSAIDLSQGAYRGRIYLAWPALSDKGHNIHIIQSDDEGKTWSTPVIVNDNPSPADHANPAVAVNKDGVVGVVWADRRAHPSSACYNLYFSASLDGGKTFLPNVTTGRGPTCPLAPRNWAVVPYVSELGEGKGTADARQEISLNTIASRFTNGGGDTNGLDSDVDGVFHAGWIDGASGVTQLATTTFTVKGRPAQSGPTRPNEIFTQDPTLSPLEIIPERCKLDVDRKQFSCEARLRNRATTPIDGPFALVMDTIHRAPASDWRASNADNEVASTGATWRFELEKSSQLLPRRFTKSRVMTWTFTTDLRNHPVLPGFVFRILTGLEARKALESRHQ
jgi:hypothetical protein